MNSVFAIYLSLQCFLLLSTYLFPVRYAIYASRQMMFESCVDYQNFVALPCLQANDQASYVIALKIINKDFNLKFKKYKQKSPINKFIFLSFVPGYLNNIA